MTKHTEELQEERQPMTIDEIFGNDSIGDRIDIAKGIASIIDQECDDKKGFVLAIDGRWGSGKTTFVGMLENYLRDICKYRVISFNCWERDFVDDPLIAMLAEMTNVVGTGEDKYNRAINSARKIALGAAVGAAKAIIGEPANALFGAVKGGIEATEDDIKKYLDAYDEQVKSIGDFKKSLCDFIKNDNKEKQQVILIVDELDRCNPHYAVKVLERIKHLFDIPNLFIILPICKSQLECAIQGYFGSEKLDANVYLRRFIDLEMRLPIVNLMTFCEKALNTNKVMQHISNSNDNYNKIKVSEYINETAHLFESTNTDLRTINKILCLVSKVMDGRYGYEAYQTILMMCYLKFNHIVLYGKISRRVITVSKLLEELEDVLNGFSVKNPNNSISIHVVKLVASVLFVYNRKNRESQEKLDEVLEWQKLEKGKSTTSFDKRTISDFYLNMSNNNSLCNITMEELIRDIDNPLSI